MFTVRSSLFTQRVFAAYGGRHALMCMCDVRVRIFYVRTFSGSKNMGVVYFGDHPHTAMATVARCDMYRCWVLERIE